MSKILSTSVFMLTLLVSTPALIFAATGDVIYSGCGDKCDDSYAGSATGWKRTIENTGCVSGECLKLNASFNTGSRYGAGNTRISITSVAGHDELTVVYYVKLNPGSRSLRGGNVKGFRSYIGNNKHLYGTMDAHFGYDHYSSVFKTLTLKEAGAFETVKQNSEYCYATGDKTYSCPVRLDIKFKTSDGQQGFPSGKWRKVRRWIKLPTSYTSKNGEAKLWIDEELVYHAYDVQPSHDEEDHFTVLTFYPSSEAEEPFEHWIDEMTIYEGYVPPGGGATRPVNIPGAPTNLTIVHN